MGVREKMGVRLLCLDYLAEGVVRGEILIYRDLEFTCRSF